MVDRRSLLFLNGFALAALGLTMLLPAFVDLFDDAPDARVFFAAAGATLAAGGALLTASGGIGARFNRKTGFIAIASLWLTLPLVSALPFAFSALDMSYIDGVYEAVSGLTTTGATGIQGLDAAPKGILLWRALLNAIGGLGVIAMATILLPFLQVGGMQMFRTESTDQADTTVPGGRQIAVAVLVVYLTLNVACMLAYWFGGMDAFDAVCHAMATVATGGFSTHDASLGYFYTPMIFWSAILFMLCGAFPIVLFIRLARGEIAALWRDTQVVTLLGVVVSFTALIALMRLSPDRPLDQLVPETLFAVVAAVTTSGFFDSDTARWGPLPFLAILFLIFHGGCAGSTAGGIKTMRVEVLVRQTHAQIRRIVLPHSVTPVRYNGRLLAPEVASSIASFVLLYVLTVFGVAFGLGLMGADFFTAAAAAAGAVGNAGTFVGEAVAQIEATTGLGDPARILLAFGMLFGRLEMITVLVLFTVTFWRS